MRVVEQLFGLCDRRERQSAGLELVHEFGLGQAAEQFAHHRNDPIASGDSIRIPGKARVGGQFPQAKVLAERDPLRVAHDANEQHLVVGRFEDVVDRPGRNALWHRRRRFPGDGLLRHVLANKERGGFVQRAFDVLAVAGAVAGLDGRENAYDAEHAAGHIDHGRPGAQRPPRRTGHVGKTAHHLGHFIQRRALLVGPGEKTAG